MHKTISLTLVLFFLAPSVLADYTITQRRTLDDVSFEVTFQAKGVRIRRSQKMIFESEEDKMASQMMESMMPSITHISQCDLRQDLEVNEKTRSYFIEYHDWSSLPAETRDRRPKQKVVVKGTVTLSSVVVDSGKRQTMFGLTARWLKHTMEYEFSPDSCDGASKTKIESEGWFVDLALESDSCPVPPPPPDDGGCRPRPVFKTMQYPGFLLEGTTATFVDGKKEMVDSLETVALNKDTLDQSLFDVPMGFAEVDSRQELMEGRRGPVDTSAVTRISGDDSPDGKSRTVKTVAIDFFSGRSSKVEQEALRSHIADKIGAAGLAGYLINSQAELQTGNFAYVISVDIKKVKESGGAKLGGLFGKVTGSPDAAKLGDSEAEIEVTLFAKDRKTVLGASTAIEKVKGSVNDAVKAALDKALPDLLPKLR